MRLIPLLKRVALGLVLTTGLQGALMGQELGLDATTRANLDAWELNRLESADQAWRKAQEKASKSKKQAKNLYNAANAAYQLFIEEFPRSPAVAYALFRQGRSFHLDNKRDSARQIYQDIIEFFPDQKVYATAALWYKGKSHQEDGNDDDAIRTWAEIAKNDQYRVQPLAADALLNLGTYLIKQKRYPEAIDYLTSMAKDFRTRNAGASYQAIRVVTRDLIRRQKNEADLKKFYISVRGFSSRPIKDFKVRETEQLQDDPGYWNEVMKLVNNNGRFESSQDADKKSYWNAWAPWLTDRWENWDLYRLNRVDWKRNADGDAEAWLKGVRAQYDAQRGKDGNNRVRNFMRHLSGNTPQVREIFRDLEWSSMSAKETIDTVSFCFRTIKDNDLGFRALSLIPDGKLGDGDLERLASFVASLRNDRAKVAAQKLADQIGNEELRAITNLRILNRYGRDEIDKKLAIAKTLHGSERFSGEARQISAQALMDVKRYQESIAEWRAWGVDPQYRYKVSECLAASGDFAKAVGELEIVERSFTNEHRSRAALLQAQFWDRAKNPEKRDGVLVRILREYRGTPEHSKAHDWRERLGDAYVGSRDNE